MVSPEQLRGCPFFGELDKSQLKLVAAAASEIIVESNVILLEENQPAEDFYIVLDGCVDVFYAASGEPNDQLLIAEIRSGEPFALSALVQPHTLAGTGRTRTRCHLLKIKGSELLALCRQDPRLGRALMRQTAKSIMDRLHLTRVRLAALRAAAGPENTPA